MTGVDWPGRSAVHNGLFASILSGKFFSRDVPFWFGPRQLSQPWTGAACVGGTAANWPAAATLRAPTTNEREKFMCSGRKVQCLRRNNKTNFLSSNAATILHERDVCNRNNTYTYNFQAAFKLCHDCLSKNPFQRLAADRRARPPAPAHPFAPRLVWIEPGISPPHHPPGHHAGPVHGHAHAA